MTPTEKKNNLIATLITLGAEQLEISPTLRAKCGINLKELQSVRKWAKALISPPKKAAAKPKASK